MNKQKAKKKKQISYLNKQVLEKPNELKQKDINLNLKESLTTKQSIIKDKINLNNDVDENQESKKNKCLLKKIKNYFQKIANNWKQYSKKDKIQIVALWSIAAIVIIVVVSLFASGTVIV